MTLTKSVPGKKAGGRLPVKKSINLAQVNVQRMNIPAALLGSVLIIIAAIIFSKFGVIDRLNAMSQAQGQAAALRAEISLKNARLNELSGVAEDYAHYTVSGMTPEELSRCDRVKVVDLMEDVVIPGNSASAIDWTVSGNQLTVKVAGDTLQDINLLAQEMEKSDIVNFCTVSTATKSINSSGGIVVNLVDGTFSEIEEEEEEVVTATVVAYLQNYSEVDSNEKPES